MKVYQNKEVGRFELMEVSQKKIKKTPMLLTIPVCKEGMTLLLGIT